MNISQLSQKLAASLYDYSNGDVSISKLRYGIETILTGFIKLGTFFGISLYMGIFHEMLIALVTFIPLRLISGGAHLSTYIRCLLAGGTWFVLSSFLSQKYLTEVSVITCISAIIITCFISLLICIKYAPNSHGYRKIDDVKQKKLKRLSIGFIVIYFLILLLFVYTE
ncbi:MAG TPA: accessory gene regulator B family protein, partial [Bacillota bacterium]|nr:accessory gene regulator B family protein [Bacillota bacterium]